MSKNNYRVTFYKTKYRGHTVDIVKNLNDDINLVITLGGDGTFNESVRGNFLRKKRLVLAHLPVGTTNDIGTMYGYGRNIYTNLEMLMNGEIKKTDICTINGIPFVYVAGFGKYLNIPYMTSREDKKKLGYLAYMINGIKEFIKFIRLCNITYEVDGEIYKGYYSFIICTNSTRVAGLKNILSDTIKLDDNKFEIVLCNISSRKKLINSLLYLVTSDINHVPGFYYHKTDEIKIHMQDDKGSEWDIDGEKLDIDTPDIVIKMDRNTELMIPKKNIDKLFVNKK